MGAHKSLAPKKLSQGAVASEHLQVIQTPAATFPKKTKAISNLQRIFDTINILDKVFPSIYNNMGIFIEELSLCLKFNHIYLYSLLLGYPPFEEHGLAFPEVPLDVSGAANLGRS